MENIQAHLLLSRLPFTLWSMDALLTIGNTAISNFKSNHMQEPISENLESTHKIYS